MSIDPDQIVDRRRLKRRITAWRTLAILTVAGLLFLLLQHQVGDRFVGDHIAWLDVRGIITEDRYRQENLAKLVKSEQTRALIVYIDSPGGTTYGGEELFLILREIADKKPVVAIIGTLGTSAGYLVALASERIYARETSITGSIGVLLETAEISQLLSNIGVTTDTVKSGEFKNTPSPFQPMTETGRAVVQSLVDDSYLWFVEILAERRNFAMADARRLGDGRVYTGRQALAASLIDALGSTIEARQWLESQHNISEKLPMRDVSDRDNREGLLGRILSLAEKMMSSERLTLDGLISVWHPEL